MKKTSRSTNCGAKGSAQSSMNPYHKMRCGYASGGSIPGSDVSNATNGQSKKVNTPGEEVFRGKSISKNFAKGGNIPKRGGGGILGDLLGLFGLAEGGQVPKRGGGGILGDLLGLIGLDEGGQVPKSSGCRLRTGLRDVLPEEGSSQRAKRGKWIQKAVNPSNKGKLHRELGVPQGQKIPAKKLMRAEHSSNPKLAKQARLAQTLKSFHNRKI